MGLKEKRFTKTFQEEQYPALKEQINVAAGFDITLETAWETLFEDRFLHLYSDSYPKIYFQPLIESFSAITADDMGKEALKESLKKVVIVNNDNHHNPTNAYTFSEGVLQINHSPILNADDVSSRTKVLTSLLENNL
ncbi:MULTISPECIES: hypothetical protein [Tenacibaculum]|jgi:hypothetical protein|uniref:Uncharacterized protein n=1 Tax=Tenacibaculum soleae TaxID=447689 RepID=A0A1B9Y2D0_9FLAO|nr:MULTISPECIES: hypothetical protein [Tenacibaculum]MCT4699249.1 hypothetical protein [Tenacibaculum haliotis]MDO6744460.1 hypothetical protein [Tenacibaculum soleae]MDO6812856.1 hypothetical protein [Tenacibaculum soleae]OCK43964.1 hypothetical protein BA195_04520 [Tenacibaculum soleae]WBX77156.1 hypothetical protein PG911_02530 [Tenacibaculum ovolyticum]